MTAFDDLENAANEQDEEQTEDAVESNNDSEQDEAAMEEVDPRSTPAFEFSSDLRRSVYARNESWQDFEDTVDLDATRILREHDVRDVQTREVHDAAIRLAAEHPKELAKLILEARDVEMTEE